jgi:hypothetical protein
MQIAAAGWYFSELFINHPTKYDVFTVAHKEPPAPLESCKVIPNVGLEFGCYDWYLKNKWESGDVLFIHDDNEITENALDLIAGLNRDQVFLFTSEAEAKANGYAHGRAIFCSEKFLKRLKEDGGYWFDEGNHGDIEPTSADKPNYHNSAIQVFKSYVMSLPKEYTVNKIAIVPGLKCGYRGRL